MFYLNGGEQSVAFATLLNPRSTGMPLVTKTLDDITTFPDETLT